MTCDDCLAGKHFKCRGCGCQAKEFHRPKKIAVTPKPRAVKPTVKQRRTRTYSVDVVAEAARLRAKGRTWREIGQTLNVPTEGIRYAVVAYGPKLPERVVEAGFDVQSLKDAMRCVQSARAEALAAIARLDEISEMLAKTTEAMAS